MFFFSRNRHAMSLYRINRYKIKNIRIIICHIYANIIYIIYPNLNCTLITYKVLFYIFTITINCAKTKIKRLDYERSLAGTCFRYRLMAIDHGLLSFIDVTHREWPVVLVTNPKHSLFRIPGKENFDVIRNSTHIRFV